MSTTPRLTQVFVRAPFYVDAVQVTHDNFYEVVNWCEGKVEYTEPNSNGHKKKYIKVDVQHPQSDRHTTAFVGDYVVRGSSGFRVYKMNSFNKTFEPVDSPEQGMTVGQEAKLVFNKVLNSTDKMLNSPTKKFDENKKPLTERLNDALDKNEAVILSAEERKELFEQAAKEAISGPSNQSTD